MSAYRLYLLPWDDAGDQERRFRETQKRVLVAVAVLAVLLTLLPLPERDPNQAEPVPPRLARLVLEKPVPPPPPVVTPPPREEPVVAETRPETPRPVERPVERVVERPAEPVVDRTAQAREKAATAGLLPFADQLAELRDNQALGSVTSNRPLAGTVGEAQRVDRALITSTAAAGSGGISTAALSRDTGGSGLAGRDTTRVASTIAGNAGGEASGTASESGPGQRPSRSREEIEMVFDQNKGAIYALYNRALRQNPALQGKLVLRLTIEPSGEVSLCEVVSSELGDEELERRLIQRVRMFRFSDRDVAPVTTTKPIDFFPA
jgi:outer membrane biosynthesis protein TonB